MISTKMRSAFVLFAGLSIAVLNASPAPAAGAETAAATTAQTFSTTDAAVTALAAALRGGKLDVAEAVLGPGSGKLLTSGDQVADAAARQRFLAAYDEHHELVAGRPDRMTLQVGKDNWPLPIPLVQENGSWHFDSVAGAQELVDRRIGRNEIAAIRTSLAYVDAQNAFREFTGQLGEAQYALRLVASPGKYDGLYWPAGEGVPNSPLEPLVAQARDEGYPIDRSAKGPRPYNGYYFRILTGQGARSPEGARNYISNGRMTNGFALVAWPAVYGTSGIMSFIVNQDGVVFQKDLGPRTPATASTMTLFDPDLSWALVDVVN